MRRAPPPISSSTARIPPRARTRLYSADPTARTDPSEGLTAVVTRGRLYTRADLEAALEADRRRLRRPLPALLGRIGSARVLRTTDFSF
ncbi:hypothetical protein ACWDA7_33850 [Streptomyces sp. NPDC001156]